ncbi:hypothetical protein CVU83_01625 [Candidatus Falkowbacteria bacterium HGW-Falkowbacteria-2]|uniref:Uncharacterized protein n=1 Tax=Candidatus Falkowbacteria bacterium HGW-Falkowbacteria-2 TaxID=2013769 RepID=A0A2N2E1B5_9BACT|nr:MAG: hypothetical protein CVU83_01625 [Candidatus Falkowbacteria bacterium HGW-Falkowbacteria-2]
MQIALTFTLKNVIIRPEHYKNTHIMKTTVAYFPGDYTIVYALAACLKAGFELHPASNMHELWDINSRQIVLLDIDSENPAFADFESYREYMRPKIISCLSLADLYESATQKLNNNKVALQIWKQLIDIDDVFKSIVSLKKGYLKDITIKRFAYALRSASIKASNTNDQLFYYKTLENIAAEIADLNSNSEIDILAIYCERVNDTTKAAFKRITCNHSIFTIPYREVAYAYLANISPWLDLDELKKMAKEHYPYLSILQYRANDKEYTWIGSKYNQLDIRQFFDLPRKVCEYQYLEAEEAWIISRDSSSPTSDDEFIGVGSHRHVSRFLRRKIKELTTQ